MAIKPNFTPAKVGKELKLRLANIEKALLNRLKIVAERFITNARNNHTYTDQTGNLTSSVGYIIMKDGVQMANAFPGDKAEGKAKAQSIAKEVSERYQKGYVLIVVAGMEYAAAVESRNYDVITASSITAETDLRKSLEELRTKIR